MGLGFCDIAHFIVDRRVEGGAIPNMRARLGLMNGSIDALRPLYRIALQYLAVAPRNRSPAPQHPIIPGKGMGSRSVKSRFRRPVAGNDRGQRRID